MAAVLLQSPEESLRPATVFGKLLDEAADERQREADLRHRRDVVEVDLEPVVAHPLDGLGEEAEQPLLARTLVVERRQHQHAAAAQVHGVARQHDGIGQRASASAGHELCGLDAVVHQLLEQLHALVEAERVGFAGGAERREPRAALLHQPVRMVDEALGVGAAILAEGGQHRGDNACESGLLVHEEPRLGLMLASRRHRECRAA